MAPFWQDGLFLEGEGLTVNIGHQKYELTNLISKEHDPETNQHEIVLDGQRILASSECKREQGHPNDVIVTLRLQMNPEEMAAWERAWTLERPESEVQSSLVDYTPAQQPGKSSQNRSESLRQEHSGVLPLNRAGGLLRMLSTIFFSIPFVLDTFASYLHAMCAGRDSQTKEHRTDQQSSNKM